MNDLATFTDAKVLSFGEDLGEVYSFDAWGNRRSTSDWTAAESSTTTNNHLFSRGFTGHEHLDAFGLINMNGRCYDPLLGRVLSPDPELQDPANIQNYNRYSYCLNNPLKYTDPSGYYIYGKTYQVDPVYSIPHFSDLDLPGGCRYDIAEYLDEMQNKIEMEQMELNSMFGLNAEMAGGYNKEDKSNTNVNTSSPSYYGNNDDNENSEDGVKIPPKTDGFVDPFDILTGNDVLIPKTTKRDEFEFIDVQNLLTVTTFTENSFKGNCPWGVTYNMSNKEISQSYDFVPGIFSASHGSDGVLSFTAFDMLTYGQSINGNMHFELSLPWTSQDKRIGLSLELHTQDLMNRWGNLIHNAIQNTSPYIYGPTNSYKYGWEWSIGF